MGLPVLIIGKSGSGKSASLRNFNEGLALINVLGKPLPLNQRFLRWLQMITSKS
ncbi:hypothetical protein [Clostridium sp. KNHs205]|uniref:hypothetical protein n=1 Tax=Clostridium sp. KNHs205 TaxID=1449050 RepID=UPI000A58DF6E|nr:hypothetical protein [Clostridium sp. KNHs205]